MKINKEYKNMRAYNMFMNNEIFGVKPTISLYPLQDWIDNCDGDEECIAGLDHSLNIDWHGKEGVAWISFDFDSNTWYAGKLDKKFFDFMKMKPEDLSREEIVKYNLNTSWMFDKQITNAIIQQLKELEWFE